ncbi:hypothetical protein C8Q74DRAFT_1364234 [Fomes fomentarius]|nr:hypothetical protein C8Q74DRAFT_1364234 [Fomes fomentarius]
MRALLSCRTLILCALAALGSSTLINRTIDDQYGDSLTGGVPTYLPEKAWTLGSDCPSCFITSKLKGQYDGTWHYTAFGGTPNPTPSVQATFHGTAVYVFNIIANFAPSAFNFSAANLNFYIDGAYVGQYVHLPDPTAEEIALRVPVYVNESLSNAEHTFIMGTDGPNNSMIAFDYLIYTTDSESADPAQSSGTYASPSASPSPSTSQTALESGRAVPLSTIVPSVVGSVGGLLVLILGVILYRKFACARFSPRGGNAGWNEKLGPEPRWREGQRNSSGPDGSSEAPLGSRSYSNSVAMGNEIPRPFPYTSHSSAESTSISASPFLSSKNKAATSSPSTPTTPPIQRSSNNPLTSPRTGPGESALPPLASPAGTSHRPHTEDSVISQVSTTGNSVPLQAQVVALQEEVARLREHIDTDEAPPRYNELL